MRSWKRLFFYLTINILVSACTTLGVLLIWDQVRGPLPRGLLPRAASFFQRATPTPVESAAPGVGETAAPQAAATEEYMIYQVQGGETFESLAEEYNVSVEELLRANGFNKSQPLGAGEVLRIPAHPQGSVIIDSVIGAGDLNSERVLLKHRGEGELTLVGWRLEDSNGNAFVFPPNPQLILYRGGAVNVYTKAGNSTVVDMYWGLDHAVWYSGAQVILKDAQGNVRAVYKVP